MVTLQLTLKRQWFDLIQSGEKLEEYREIKDYWCQRLLTSKEEIEWGAWEEMINDWQSPFHRHNGPEELMKYFGVSFKNFDFVHFRNGYQKNAPKMTLKIKGISTGAGKPEWGAEPGKFYFVIKLGEVKDEMD